MSIKLTPPRPEKDFKPRITVVGVGGAGGNAVNNMIRASLEGVEFLVCNTDAQAMNHTLSERHLQLGAELTQGLGAGSRPDVGRAATEESLNDVMEQLTGNHMVFITAGMGGGTGTGGAPVIARATREKGMLTVGVITKPFHFEGKQRMKQAEAGIAELAQFVDTLIVIPNQNLFRVANEKTTFADAFKMADDVLYAGVRSVTDLMVMPGLINLDFADIRAVMAEMGKAMMGTGEAEGDNRAIEAAEAAIANPLLEDISMKGAHGLLINITGGNDMTLMEVDEAVNRILEEVDPDAHMIFGSTFDDSLEGRIRISVVATGIDVESMGQMRPVAAPVLHAVETAPEPLPAVALELAEVAVLDEAPAPQAAGALAEAAADMLSLMDAPEPAANAGEKADTGFTLPDLEAARGTTPDIEFTSPGPGNTALSPEPRIAAGPVADAPFIPPAPATRDAGPHAAETGGRARPFAEAAMENGGDAPRRKRSLFERMTSSIVKEKPVQIPAPRIKPEAAAPVQPEMAPPVMPKTPAPVMPRAAASKAPEAALPVQPEAGPVSPTRSGGPAAPEPPAEPRLGALDPNERIAPTRAQDEMLDIPAFLRRQAN
jgi:cell division protein FtsZ